MNNVLLIFVVQCEAIVWNRNMKFNPTEVNVINMDFTDS